MLSKVSIKKLISILSICLISKLIISQTIEINFLSLNVNTKNAELNFFQKDSMTAYYSAIYSEDNLDQSAIFKVNKSDGEWQKGTYYGLGEFYSVANIFIDENGLWYFSACEEKDQKYNIYVFDEERDYIKKLDANINSKKYNSTQPFVVNHNNQRAMYFVSDREDGFGGNDIWLSIIDVNGKYGVPINLGKNINTEHDEITPFYNVWSNEIFFSSNNVKVKGFDIYKSEGKLNLWKKRNELLGFNTAQDEMYLNFFNSKAGHFSSNRRDSTLCNDIFNFNYKPNLGEKKTDHSFSNYLPLNLYFHNDEPDCCTMSDTTEQTYKQAYISYFKMEEKYMRFSKDSSIYHFFQDSLKENFNKLNIILEEILVELNQGKKIEVKIKGYASPLYKKDYNINLSKRRVSSFINYLKTYNANIFLQYLQEKKLEVSINSFGESRALETTSDNPMDKKESIYSIDAILERKIEIIDVIYQ